MGHVYGRGKRNTIVLSICESEEAFQVPVLPCGALRKCRFLN